MIGDDSAVNLKKHMSTSFEGFNDSHEFLFGGGVVELGAGKSSRFDSNRMFSARFGVDLRDYESPAEEGRVGLDYRFSSRVEMREYWSFSEEILEFRERSFLCFTPFKLLVLLSERGDWARDSREVGDKAAIVAGESNE